jgi:hypothetical protein
LDPIWTLYSRRTFSRLAYWLSALGYDLRDRSVTNRIYLIYFCAFWMVWIVAIIALLGSGLASGFDQIQHYASPPHLVVILVTYLVIIWALVVFWQVSKRSPFIFSQEDAYLLCQTPASRRKIGSACFLQGIIGVIIPLVAGTAILSFALVEWRLSGEITISMIFEYIVAALRAIILVVPAVIGIQAGLWGVGALRLHHRREPVWMRPLFIGLVLFLLVSVFFSALQPILLAPLHLSVSAAFMPDAPIPNLLGGLGMSSLYLVAGLAFLFLHSARINLSQAAQETSHIAAINQARSYGRSALVDAIELRRRLSMTREASRLLYQSGGNILFWKDLLQSLRTVQLRDVINLIGIFGLSLGMVSSPNWGLQLLIAGVWTISIGNLTTRRWRNDLARWWLLHSLPLRLDSLLRGELILSCGLYTLVGWIALAVSHQTLIFSLSAALLYPLLVACAALATTNDILRHSKARILMSPSLAEENVPRQNIWGVLQGLISVLIPFGILVLISTYPNQAGWGAVTIPVAIFIVWLNGKAVMSAFHWIE